MSNYLYHHGIKGMKWGVRRFQNTDGSLTSAGKQRYGNTSNVRRLLTSKAKFGSAERVEEKQRMLQAKIAKGGDKNIITRNFVNDWRAGRHEQLARKAEHRRAKEAYRADKSSKNKARLGRARANRLLKNGIAGMIDVDAAMHEGRYKRYRENGNDSAQAILKVAGSVVLTSVVAGAVMTGAREAAGNAAGKTIRDAFMNMQYDD